ncbi:MAG: hypothetical protein PHI98_13530 [Eubacteriales bacterium]|nr:hypothetical protein [Eubacteriales bacterium]
MQWIISVIGLVLLSFLAWGAHRPTAPAYRDAPLEDELNAHLSLLAGQPGGRERARLRAPRGLLLGLAKSIRYLNGLPVEELLPAAKWLCDNGRFLQEETVSLSLGLKGVKGLPAMADGEARILCFSRELLGHSTADLRLHKLGEAFQAWQKAQPFTVAETELLPQALRASLLALLNELARQCAAEQRSQSKAVQTARALREGNERQALRLFSVHRHSPTYLERLLNEFRKQEGSEQTLWLERYFNQHHLSADKLASNEHAHQTDHCLWISNAITSLRTLTRAPWSRLLEEWSAVHAALVKDRTYPAMDMESRAYYRAQVGVISALAHKPELSVCDGAFSLCRSAEGDEVRSHVGYYLLDDGRLALLRYLQAGGALPILSAHGLGFFRMGSWALFALLIALAALTGISWALWLPFALAFVVTGQQLALWLYDRRSRPRMIPRLQVEELDEGLQTLVVCPTMLLTKEHALSMVKHLSILHSANPDPHLHFMLLGDFQDSLTGTLASDEEIVDTAVAAIRALREDTGHPFLYMQRERVHHMADHVHMSRERKRGGLETLLKLIAGQPVEDHFTYASCPPEKLKGRYRYVITLDSDTMLPPGSALRMVGAILHPLQQRRKTSEGWRGVSILQPRMEVAAHTVETPIARLLGGQGGTDPYNTLICDYYGDLCGNGSFVGKGLIDPLPFLDATEGRMIPGSILSHDLLEGQLAGCGFASDITLYDGHPQSLKGFLFRLHRWTRGDWQLLPYVLPVFPAGRRAPEHTLDPIGKHKIWQNLLRSLADIMRVLLLLYSGATGRGWLFFAVLLLPELTALLPLSFDTLAAVAARLAVLPLSAAMRADAICRTLYRLFVSRRHLLEWTTAAQTGKHSDKPLMLFFYLSVGFSAAMAGFSLLPSFWFVPGVVLAVGWIGLPFVLPSLEHARDVYPRPTSFMEEVLKRIATGTLLYFETALSDEDHALPPDNVQIDPNKGISHRTSPTNIGLYLTSLLAAEKLRMLPSEETAQRIEATVETLEALPKWRGHLYNWYDTRTLAPMQPLFVSSVDSGNYAVSLLTCAQGIRVLMPVLPARYQELSARLDALVSAMDFQPLFDGDAELFYIGIHPDLPNEAPAHYDLLASEARLLSFVSIMLGQIPVQHWFRLGRARSRGGRVLISYSGTMFEYMMPLLFHCPVRGTLLDVALKGAFREQAAHKLGGVFGVSESGYYAFDPNLYYQYKAFGLPALALDPGKTDNVISPYSTALSLTVDLKRSFANLLKLQTLGMEGPLGYFEAADFCKRRIGDGKPFEIIRSHMSHHQGMIMVSICNLLTGGYIADLFSNLPRAQAYRLLLEEKAGKRCKTIRRPLRNHFKEAAPSPLHSERSAVPLAFPVDAHLLHGGGSTVLTDAQGGGYLSRNGVMITSFQESCHLPSGMRVFLRDSESGSYWNVADPNLGTQGTFETAQTVYQCKRLQTQATLRIFVNPLDGTVLHCLTVENLDPSERMMEVCSYLEPALCSQKEHAAHPAFQNLFIRTQRLQKYGVEVLRRPREDGAEPIFLWQLLTADVPYTVFHIQTDRTAFIGRGRSVYAPRELEQPISGLADTLGDRIEPCVSLRAQFVLPANGKAQLVFATLMPTRQDTSAAFSERYDRPESALRCYGPAVTQGEVTARYLSLTPDEQNLVSRMIGCLCYTGQPAQFRYAPQNSLPLRELWGMGISGDLPILLLECVEGGDLSLVKLLLKAHAYDRMSGLWVDLILLCDQPAGYERPLRNALAELAQNSHSHEWVGKEGGIHLIDRESLDQEHYSLLCAAARLRLSTADGELEEQLNALKSPEATRPAYLCKPSAAWKTSLPQGEELLYFNGFGGFNSLGNYVIALPPGRQTPAPWCNPLCSEHFGTLAGESGLVFSYAENSHSGRLTRWPNDSVAPKGEENFFIKDNAHKIIWSPTRTPLGYGLPVRITHSPGETVYEAAGYGIVSKLQCFTDLEDALGIRVIHLKNEDKQERILTVCHSCIFTPTHSASGVQLSSLQRIPGGIVVLNPEMDGVACLWGADPEPALSTTMSAGVFEGLWGVSPSALCMAEPLPSDSGNVAVLCYAVQLKPGESRVITSVLGFDKSREKLERALESLRSDGATLRLHQVRQSWEYRLSGLRYDLPDPTLCLLLNRWLPYQVRASRLMMRAGFYQAGGAYGFRDQLQDMLSLVHTEPLIVREHLLRCAAHQFEEGDVQHWWHPARYGVRTRISDDLLFLPFVTAIYVQVTADSGVLNEVIPYLHDRPLREEERERLSTPEVSPVEETLWQHCVRAIDAVQLGARGLPLMGGGDWNDGMNRVGGENGESVWLGMFLCEVLRRFIPLCEPVTARRFHDVRLTLLQMLDKHGWDGNWYLRGWYHQGDKLGSASSEECRIDVLPQSWAVLSGVSRERSTLAMDHVWRTLYERDIGILKLFTPPFDGEEAPGYIAGYLPGVRENGGQYTHAVPWAIAAFHQLGQDDRAWELALQMLPIRHSMTRQQAARYRVEPYVLAADIYANPQQRGRGGWTWYTGSASWYQYVMLEQLMGFQKVGNTLKFRPILPPEWDGVRLSYRYGSATYHLRAARDCPFPVADGEQLRDGRLILLDDGRIHEAIFPIRA